MKHPLLQWCAALFSSSSNTRSRFLFFVALLWLLRAAESLPAFVAAKKDADWFLNMQTD